MNEKEVQRLNEWINKLSPKEKRTLLKKIEKDYLKGKLVWDSRQGPYVKSKHGEL